MHIKQLFRGKPLLQLESEVNGDTGKVARRQKLIQFDRPPDRFDKIMTWSHHNSYTMDMISMNGITEHLEGDLEDRILGLHRGVDSVLAVPSCPCLPPRLFFVVSSLLHR